MTKRTSAIVGLLVISVAVVSLLSIDQEGEPERPSNIPPLRAGTQAAYEFDGPPRTLRQPIAADASTVEVSVTTAAVPTRTGGIVDARVLSLRSSNGTFIQASAAHSGFGFASVSTNEDSLDFDPLTTMRFLPTTGPVDGFLFENATLPQGRLPLTDVAPEAERLDQGEAARDVGAAAHVNVSWNRDEGGWYAEVTLDSIENNVRNDTIAVTYRLTPVCPLPERIHYPEVGEQPSFEARRLSCQPGEGTSRVEAPTVDRPETLPFVKTLPGPGEKLPSPYDPALEAFLKQPDIQAFRQEHPDWRLACASLHEDEDEDPWDWSWYFRIAADGERSGAWIGRLDGRAMDGSLHPRDETPPTSSPCAGQGQDPIPTATPVARVDTVPSLFEAVLDRGSWSEEAEVRTYTWTDRGATVSLTRCAVEHRQQPTGSCFEVAPAVYLDLDGALRQISALETWLAGNLSAAIR